MQKWPRWFLPPHTALGSYSMCLSFRRPGFFQPSLPWFSSLWISRPSLSVDPFPSSPIPSFSVSVSIHQVSTAQAAFILQDLRTLAQPPRLCPMAVPSPFPTSIVFKCFQTMQFPGSQAASWHFFKWATEWQMQRYTGIKWAPLIDFPNQYGTDAASLCHFPPLPGGIHTPSIILIRHYTWHKCQVD